MVKRSGITAGNRGWIDAIPCARRDSSVELYAYLNLLVAKARAYITARFASICVWPRFPDVKLLCNFANYSR